ncbi:hypothetical protein GE061_016042 [Apolygus lucorum]|uniref:Uncharacterized protein n=1 Tax=Apolygus lucorum TaxID=248454 RepID=A0A8S9XJ32_APOLU|nr:hypothetical protein GE061_016042 [Apolygus lucorum]
MQLEFGLNCYDTVKDDVKLISRFKVEDGLPGGVYGGTPRTQSSGSSSASPPANSHTTSASMLIVPHPLGGPTKSENQHHVVTQNGSGRKYQCKMCPSVSWNSSLTGKDIR